MPDNIHYHVTERTGHMGVTMETQMPCEKCSWGHKPNPFYKILSDLQQFDKTDFRSVPELQEALGAITYDAVVAMLAELSRAKL